MPQVCYLSSPILRFPQEGRYVMSIGLALVHPIVLCVLLLWWVIVPGGGSVDSYIFGGKGFCILLLVGSAALMWGAVLCGAWLPFLLVMYCRWGGEVNAASACRCRFRRWQFPLCATSAFSFRRCCGYRCRFAEVQLPLKIFR